MTTTQTRKRALVGGAAVLLLAGVATGGALLTTETSITGNTFSTDAKDPGALIPDADKLQVTGSNFDMTIEALVDGADKQVNTYDLKLPSTKFDAVSDLRLTNLAGTNPAELADALDAKVEYKPTQADSATTVYEGKLGGLVAQGNGTFTVPAGTVDGVITVTVSVEDRAAFLAAMNGKDADASVDFAFEHVYKSV